MLSKEDFTPDLFFWLASPGNGITDVGCCALADALLHGRRR